MIGGAHILQETLKMYQFLKRMHFYPKDRLLVIKGFPRTNALAYLASSSVKKKREFWSNDTWPLGARRVGGPPRLNAELPLVLVKLWVDIIKLYFLRH